MVFLKPLKSYGYGSDEEIIYRGFYRKFNDKENFSEMAGTDITAWFRFDMKENEQLKVKVALSSMSTKGALLNLKAEVPHFDFDKIRSVAEEARNRELNRVQITASETVKKNFYTSLYLAFLSPTVYMNVDSNYRGIDQNIYKAKGFVNYTTFSLWDTYRALHPLFTILQQERTFHMIKSMLAHCHQSLHSILPVWSHHANENWCMIGYYAVSVIAVACGKGIAGYDTDEATAATEASSTHVMYDGIGDYMKYGYVSAQKHRNMRMVTGV